MTGPFATGAAGAGVAAGVLAALGAGEEEVEEPPDKTPRFGMPAAICEVDLPAMLRSAALSTPLHGSLVGRDAMASSPEKRATRPPLASVMSQI